MKITFQEYVKALGSSEFAKRYQVSERTAEAYKYGVRLPRPTSYCAHQLIDRERRFKWSDIWPEIQAESD